MSYETKDASLAIIGTGAGILVLLVAASVVTSALYYKAHFAAGRGFPTAGRQTPLTLGAEQKPDALRSWQDVEAETVALGGYGWIDRKAGIARIPIARAMELLAEGVRPAAFPPQSAAVKQAEDVQDRTPMPR